MIQIRISSKILTVVIIATLIPSLFVGSLGIILFQQTHLYSLEKNESSQLADEEAYLTELVKEKVAFYDNFFEFFQNLTFYQIEFLENIYNNRESFGEFPVYWDDLNETGTFVKDPWSCSCVHVNVNSTNSVKVNSSGSFLVSMNSTTGLTNYKTTSQAYSLNETINATIRMIAPMDLLWNSSSRNNPYYLFSYFASKDGVHRSMPWHLMNETNRIYNPRIRSWYQKGESLSYGEIGISDPCIDWSTQNWTITLVAPYYFNDEFIGVMSNDIFITTIMEKIFEPLKQESGYQYLIDRKGMILARPNVTNKWDPKWDESFNVKILDKPLNQSDNSELNALVNERILIEQNGLAKIHFNEGGDKYVVFHRIPSTEWSLIVVVSVDEIIQPIMNLRNELTDFFYQTIFIFVCITSLILIAAIVTGFMLSRNISKPIVELTKATNRVSKGDFDVKFDTKAKDEIGDLERAFDRMAKSLKYLMKQSEMEVELEHLTEESED